VLFLNTYYVSETSLSIYSFEGQLCTFSRVLSLLGRNFYNSFIVKKVEIVFSFNVKDDNIFPYLHSIRLSNNIENASVLCQSDKLNS